MACKKSRQNIRIEIVNQLNWQLVWQDVPLIPVTSKVSLRDILVLKGVPATGESQGSPVKVKNKRIVKVKTAEDLSDSFPRNSH